MPTRGLYVYRYLGPLALQNIKSLIFKFDKLKSLSKHTNKIIFNPIIYYNFSIYFEIYELIIYCVLICHYFTGKN